MMVQSKLRQRGVLSPKAGVSRMRIFSVILFIGSFLLVIAVAFNYQNKKKQLRATNSSQMVKLHFWEVLPVPTLERNKMINDALRSFDNFMRAQPLADRARATSDSFNNISKMANFYHSHTQEVLPGKPSLQSMSLLDVDGHQVFLLMLAFSSDSGSPEVWELAFCKNEEGEWALDWPQFVRYHDVPWKEFISGEGADEGEFRLWVSRESALDSDTEYCLKFYAPVRNGSSELGVSCPNVMVRKDSTIGKEMYKMLRINELQSEMYKNIFALNPGKGYMRIRVVLAKKKDEQTGLWTYSLKKIIGEGWFGLSE